MENAVSVVVFAGGIVLKVNISQVSPAYLKKIPLRILFFINRVRAFIQMEADCVDTWQLVYRNQL